MAATTTNTTAAAVEKDAPVATGAQPSVDVRTASTVPPAADTPEHLAAARPGAVADPAPATQLDQPSGAIVEPAIVTAVDVGHEAVDANPRIGTSALQNAIDFNDAKRVDPSDPSFAGQGIDRSVYGDVQHAEADRLAEAKRLAESDTLTPATTSAAATAASKAAPKV